MGLDLSVGRSEEHAGRKQDEVEAERRGGAHVGVCARGGRGSSAAELADYPSRVGCGNRILPETARKSGPHRMH